MPPTGRKTNINGVDTVEIKDGATSLGFATADHATCTLSLHDALPIFDGIHSLTALATDNAGNTSSASLSVTIDTTAAVESAPDLATASDSGKSNSDDLTNVTSPTLTGTVTDLRSEERRVGKEGTSSRGFATVDHVAGT